MRTYTFVQQQDYSNAAEKDKINTDELRETVEKARAIKRDKKLLNLWVALQDALENAEAVLKNPRSQGEVIDVTAKLKVAIQKFEEGEDQQEIVDPTENGEYTVTFVAKDTGSDTSSMAQRTLDPRAKLVVKEGKMTISFLNTFGERFILDLGLVENGELHSFERKTLKTKKVEFTGPISSLKGNVTRQSKSQNKEEDDYLEKGCRC